MLNCNLVPYNNSVLFCTVVEEKYNPGKTTLRGITDRVLGSYNEYIVNFSNLERKNNSDFITENDSKISLQLCYSSPSTSFIYVRAKIFESQPTILIANCPYCMVEMPETLDHYIGQTEFPEYSILTNNLIPCCYNCNQKKDDVWRKNKKRRFIHFYNDNFLHHKFLYSKLVYSKGSIVPSINFYIQKPILMNQDDFKIVKTHFKDLNLLSIYNLKANSIISSEIDILRSNYLSGTSKAILVNNLKTRHTSICNNFGVNYWGGVIYEGLATSKKLINSL